MQLTRQHKILAFLSVFQVVILVWIFFCLTATSGLYRIKLYNEQLTSEKELYEKLEQMCKVNDSKQYNSCSRSPLCGTSRDNLSEDDRIAVYDKFVGEVGNTQDSPQSCMGDGGGRSKGCGGEYVPLCCYAMAVTGDPLKCAGYWERLWCPTDLCNEIDSKKAKACGGGKCKCGHAWGEYCKQDGATPGKQTLSLCERLKKEGVSGVVCTTSAVPTPVNVYTKPTCSSFNFIDANNNIINSNLKLSSSQSLNIQVIGVDDTSKPQRIDLCWALANQAREYYNEANNWACKQYTSEIKQGVSSNIAVLEVRSLYFSDLMKSLNNVTTQQFKDYGILIVPNIFSAVNPNQFCSTNPAYNNGSGVYVDIAKQLTSEKFVNSICGLGNVGQQSKVSCTLQVMYLTSDDSIIDFNSDKQINIEDFTWFVTYYKAKDLKIDFNKDSKTGIEDFAFFKTEYVRFQ